MKTETRKLADQIQEINGLPLVKIHLIAKGFIDDGLCENYLEALKYMLEIETADAIDAEDKADETQINHKNMISLLEELVDTKLLNKATGGFMYHDAVKLLKQVGK